MGFKVSTKPGKPVRGKSRGGAKTPAKVAAVRNAGGTAGSLRQLAKLLGCSHTAVNRAARREDWAFRKPYPVAKVRTWMAAVVPADHASPEDERGGRPLASRPMTETQRVKLAILNLDLEGKRRETEEFKRQWHRVDECTRKSVEKVLAVKAAILSLPDSGLVERLLVSTADEAKAMLRGRLTEICQEFASGGS